MNAITTEALLAHHNWVRALARSLVRDPNEADDLVQETWMAALKRPPLQPGSVRAWLGRVVRNAAKQTARGESRRDAREHRSARPESSGTGVADVVARAEAQRLLVQSVLALPEPGRAAILLRFFDEQPPREIAKQLGVPVETVRARIRRALARLREELDDAHGGDRSVWTGALLPLLGAPSAPPAADPAPAVVSSTSGILAACVATLLGVAVGVAGQRSEQADEVARLDNDLSRAVAVVSEKRSRLAHVADRLAATETRTAATRADIEDLRGRSEILSVRREELTRLTQQGPSAEIAVVYAGPRFRFEGYEEAFDEMDWSDAGRRLYAMVRLLRDLAGHVETATEPSPEMVGRAQELNGPLVTLALELAGAGIPAETTNSVFSHPAVYVHLLAATVDVVGLPLTDDQTATVEGLARRYEADDRRRIERGDEDAAPIVVLAEQTALRQEFVEKMISTLTPAQADKLRPTATRGRVGADIFSVGLVWTGRTLTLVARDREEFGQGVWDRATNGSDEESQETRAAFDAWLREVPDRAFGVVATNMDTNGWHHTDLVVEWAGRYADLHERMRRAGASEAILARTARAVVAVPFVDAGNDPDEVK